MEYKFLKVEKREKIVIARISRPDVMNALNTEVLKELERFIDEMEKDASCKGDYFYRRR
jgi:enoyl-CoA hydratase/carnithine racemase